MNTDKTGEVGAEPEFSNHTPDANEGQPKRVLLAMGLYDRGFRRGTLHYAQKANWSLHSETSIWPLVPEVQEWDGIVAVPTYYTPLLLRYVNTFHGTPMVWADPEEFTTEKASVLTDHTGIGHRMADYLLSQGVPNIAYYGGMTGLHDADERRSGVIEACRAANAPYFDIEFTANTSKQPQDRIMESLAKIPKPFGVCAVNDLMASVVVNAVVQLGLEIPEDVSIIGAENDSDLCELSPIGITSVDGNTFRQAEVACEMLDKWMASGTPPHPRQVIIPPGDVVPRESTGFAGSTNPEIQKALHFVEAHFKDPSLTIDAVIDTLDYKKSAAYKLFQKECGVGISKYIVLRRIRHARLLLVSTNLNLAHRQSV